MEAVIVAAERGQSFSGCNATYLDSNGNEKSIESESVVVSGGPIPRYTDAMNFHETADRFFMMGNCRAVGNVQKCMRSVFAAASQI
jgi:hypothetical protein